MDNFTIIVLTISVIVSLCSACIIYRYNKRKSHTNSKRKRLKNFIYGDILLILAIPILGFFLFGDLSEAMGFSQKFFSNIGIIALIISPYVIFAYKYFQKDKTAKEKEDEQN